ncbi:MAG: OmpA family protein [Bacteroidales bacterium]
MRKVITVLTIISMTLVSCVPASKFNDMEARYENLREQNATTEERLDDCLDDNERMRDEIAGLRRHNERLEQDTTHLGESLRKLREQHEQFVEQTETLMEGQTAETRQVMERLQETQRDLQRREDELNRAMREMEEKELRVNELEDILQRQDSIVEELRHTVSNALLGFQDEGLSVEIRNGKVYVSLEENLLFATGSTQIDSQGEQALSELAAVLEQNPDINVMIEGHTDDVPVKPGASFKDNWDLSVLRATAIVRILKKHGDIDPQRFIAAGRGEYHPVDPEDSPEARRKNRRTEIILTPQLDELFRIIEQH